MVQLYKGAEGSIRCISCHSSEPVMAACGLDRHVRLYDVHSRRLLHKVLHMLSYVKSPFDSPRPLSYRLPIVTYPLASFVSEIFGLIVADKPTNAQTNPQTEFHVRIYDIHSRHLLHKVLHICLSPSDYQPVCCICSVSLSTLVWWQEWCKKADIALHGTPSQSYGTSLAVWDHTVLPATRHK